MKPPGHRLIRVPRSLVLAVCASFLAGGCATAPRMAVRAQRYRIDVQLDPATHRIVGRTSMDLVRIDERALSPDQPVAIELQLHPNLRITDLHAGGVEIRSSATTRVGPARSGAAQGSEPPGDFVPRRHFVFLKRPVESLTLFVEYEGTLFQDVAAGEKPGEIHNFAMRAHVGTDGIYLADGKWYPQPDATDGLPIPADHTLLVAPVAGFELAASGERDPVLSEQTGAVAWRSPYPLSEMVLVGGAHQVHEGRHRDVTIRVHLKPSQSEQAAGLIESVGRYMDRYEPLIGPYPARQYTVVDNFFSSGFAFPTFTLLSSAVIDMGERSRSTHGYLDHEMLHSWWGNGVHVDPRDGNWCEALTSYCTNYYGFVLDGDEQEARRKRRNFSHFLSRLKPENDLPLGTFGQKDGCNRSIAYDKGAAVFHMLARTIGQERFWSAMRRLTSGYVGKFVSWDDIRRVCEAEGGKDLGPFFLQWVRRGGAPRLAIEAAKFDSASQSLTITLAQGDPPFSLDVPIRVDYGSTTEDVTAHFDALRADVKVPVSGTPRTVELDPDYHLFRRMAPEQIVPTTASTRTGKAFTCVLPAGDVPEPYRKLQSVFASSFKEGETLERVAGGVEGDALAERCALILGDAARQPYVEAFLGAIEYPVEFNEDGFEFDGVEYHDPGDAVLCTTPHPGVPGGGVTVIYANSPEAIPSSFAVPMYDRSVVIFQHGRATVKHDLERRAIVTVERT